MIDNITPETYITMQMILDETDTTRQLQLVTSALELHGMIASNPLIDIMSEVEFLNEHTNTTSTHVPIELLSSMQTKLEARTIWRDIHMILEAGTKVLRYPTKPATSVTMVCQCGHEHSSSIISKRPQYRKNQDIGLTRLYCANCEGEKRSMLRQLNSDVPAQLAAANIKLTADYQYSGYRTESEYECGICSHKWMTNPQKILMSASKYGMNSCPSCRDERRTEIRHEKDTTAETMYV